MMDLKKLEELQRGVGIVLPVSGDVDGRIESADAKFAIYDEGGATEQQAEYVIALLNAAPELVAAANESARSQRLFMAACEALGAVSEKLGLDPDDGGADPIIEAIDQLQADLAAARRPAAEPLHDNLRDQIGQAINDAIASGAPEADYCDSREIDRLADAVLAILPPLRTKTVLSPELRAALDDATKTGALVAMLPNGSAVFINRGEQPGDFGEADECPACGGSGDKADAAKRATSTTSLIELRDLMHSAAQAGELIVLAPEAAGALVLAMSTGAPAGMVSAPTVDLSGQSSADPVVETNVALLRSRSAVGIEKYGTTLADSKAPLRDWLEHALLEVLDCANYLQTAMLKIDAPPQAPLTQAQIDRIGEQWDSCMYDDIDIGAAIRAELEKLGAPATPAATVAGGT